METTQDRTQRKPERFSIESILNQTKKPAPKEIDLTNQITDLDEDQEDIEVDDMDDDDLEDEEEEDSDAPASGAPIPIRPTPRPLIPEGLLPPGPPPGAAGTPLPSLFPSALHTTLSPNQLLYSQWLATKNTNALFGLQGNENTKIMFDSCYKTYS